MQLNKTPMKQNREQDASQKTKPILSPMYNTSKAPFVNLFSLNL